MILGQIMGIRLNPVPAGTLLDPLRVGVQFGQDRHHRGDFRLDGGIKADWYYCPCTETAVLDRPRTVLNPVSAERLRHSNARRVAGHYLRDCRR